MTLWKLAQWYRCIYEMPVTDRPSKEIIEDDEKLDKWYDQFTRDQARMAGRHSQQRRGSSENDRERAVAQAIFTPEQVQTHQR